MKWNFGLMMFVKSSGVSQYFLYKITWNVLTITHCWLVIILRIQRWSFPWRMGLIVVLLLKIPSPSFINHSCEWLHTHIHSMHANAVCLDKVSTCDSGLGLWFLEEICWDQSTCAFSVWSDVIFCVLTQMILLALFVDLVL